MVRRAERSSAASRKGFADERTARPMRKRKAGPVPKEDKRGDGNV